MKFSLESFKFFLIIKCDLDVLAKKLANPFGHLMQVFMQLLAKSFGGAGEQWYSGKIDDLPLKWPGFIIPVHCYMWIEFLVGSHLVPRVFLQVLQFLHSTKTQIKHSSSSSTRRERLHENQLRLRWLPLKIQSL